MTQKLETPSDGLPESASFGKGRLIAIGVGLLCLLFIVLVFNSVVQRNRAFARQEALSKGKHLALGIQNYHKANMKLPSNRVDDAGSDIQSWRVSVLPWIGQSNLYSAIEPLAPWDSTDHMAFNDATATHRVVPVFQSPQGVDTVSPLTHFVSITDQASPMAAESMTLEMVATRDGKSNTALFVEFPDSDINWAEPRDVTLAEAIDIIKNSEVPLGTVVAMADGDVILVPNTASKEDLTKLFLLDNGQPEGNWWNEK